MWARMLLRERISRCQGNEFQALFAELMKLTDPGFIDVRTHGNYGDQGADGLSPAKQKIFACYGPGVVDGSAVIKKFREDLASSIRQRASEFSIFVFVHNDLRGIHPFVASALAEATRLHPSLCFEIMGGTQLSALMNEISLEEVENLLGPLPIDSLVRVGADDLAELIDDLESRSTPLPTQEAVRPVPQSKLNFNAFSEDTREELVRGFLGVSTVENYYRHRRDALGKQSAADGLASEYSAIRKSGSGPDQVWAELEMYVIGTRIASPSRRKGCRYILAHFFESCDIFEEPPKVPTRGGESE